MSDATPHLGLPLIAAAQAQKHVTHNEALGLLDALVQLACLDKDLSAPPPSPAEGDRYLVTAASPTGAWAGLSGQVVRFQDGVWTGAVPRPGWFAYVIDETDLYIFDGSAWASFRRAITAIQITSRLGINTTPDATNRLALKSDAALLSWDDVTPGSGSMRVSVNKQAAARDAGLIFQTGYSARVLLGTLGSDDFTLKVSGDGAGFATALTASAATGGIDFASSETALAGAATTDLGTAGTRRVVVSGSATITGFGGIADRERFVRFSGASRLTHDAAKLVLPTRADIVTAADDTCIATSDASGNWRVRHYQRADGTALVGGGVTSVAGRSGTVTLAVADVSGAAPLASPALTGTPTAPNPAAGTNTAQVATTSFVAASFVTYAYAAASYATLASPTLTGTPTAPTPSVKDNSTKLATTAYVDRGGAAMIARTQVNDAAYAILPGDRTVAVIALTAARTLTLPAASAYPQGATLTVIDESGACSAKNTVTLAQAGTADAVNGGAGVVIAAPYGYVALQSNGSNKWTVVDAAATTLLSFRNRLINGNLAVNQRGASGASGSYPAGTYTLDRWKAGANGVTLSFSTAANGDVTVSISSGTLLQVIEGPVCLPEGGAYVLSWSGTAAGRVYQGQASGSYGAGPVAAAGLAAGTNTTIEFGTGTLGLVQFEPGSVATPFERRDDELRRCRAYFRFAEPGIGAWFTGGGSSQAQLQFSYADMRPGVVPTITLVATGNLVISDPGIANVVFSVASMSANSIGAASATMNFGTGSGGTQSGAATAYHIALMVTSNAVALSKEL